MTKWIKNTLMLQWSEQNVSYSGATRSFVIKKIIENFSQNQPDVIYRPFAITCNNALIIEKWYEEKIENINFAKEITVDFAGELFSISQKIFQKSHFYYLFCNLTAGPMPRLRYSTLQRDTTRKPRPWPWHVWRPTNQNTRKEQMSWDGWIGCWFVSVKNLENTIRKIRCPLNLRQTSLFIHR